MNFELRAVINLFDVIGFRRHGFGLFLVLGCLRTLTAGWICGSFEQRVRIWFVAFIDIFAKFFVNFLNEKCEQRISFLRAKRHPLRVILRNHTRTNCTCSHNYRAVTSSLYLFSRLQNSQLVLTTSSLYWITRLVTNSTIQVTIKSHQ